MIAARRALHSRRALLRPRPGAAAIAIDGSDAADDTNRARSAFFSCRPIMARHDNCSPPWSMSTDERSPHEKRRYYFSTSERIETAWHYHSEDAIGRVGNVNIRRDDSMTILCRPFSTESIESASSSDDPASEPEFPETSHRTPRRRRKPTDQSPEPTGDHHSTTNAASSETTTPSSSAAGLPPLTPEEYDPENVIKRIHLAAAFDQGRTSGQPHSNVRGGRRRHNERKWDHDAVRRAADDYERHLRYVSNHLHSLKNAGGSESSSSSESSASSSDDFEDALSSVHPSPSKSAATHRLLAPPVLSKAVRALTRCRTDTPLLSARVRDLERLVGSIGRTPITEELSYRLLEANGKAGNARRTLALLELRRRRGYPPREMRRNEGTFGTTTTTTTTTGKEGEYAEEEEEETRDGGDDGGGGGGRLLPGEKEFAHALTAISAAQLPLRRARNVYLHESRLPPAALENPTNHLDAILINMHRRGVPLTPAMAARMLGCYASSGRTGRAVHYFYRVARDPVEEDGYYVPGPHPTSLGRAELEEWRERMRREGRGRMLTSGFGEEDDDEGEDSMGMETLLNTRRMKPRMIMHPPPPFHKVPSAVEGRRLNDPYHSSGGAVGDEPSSSSSPEDRRFRRPAKKTKHDWELDREYSPSLAAAFAFADSLTHGACGHDPIRLDVVGWNCLVKACCVRGAFHRAIKLLDVTMPQKGIEPDAYSYNTLLSALARVGDVPSLKGYLTTMTNAGVPVDKYAVQALADGFLNAGDVAGASAAVQDVFNQHDALPPYTTHLKIVEHALAQGLVFEARGHVYFLQQLWKWRPSERHEERFKMTVEATKRNPKLSRKALQKLFRYFHEELSDDDFF